VATKQPTKPLTAQEAARSYRALRLRMGLATVLMWAVFIWRATYESAPLYLAVAVGYMLWGAFTMRTIKKALSNRVADQTRLPDLGL
jgi:hypothetical protein